MGTDFFNLLEKIWGWIQNLQRKPTRACEKDTHNTTLCYCYHTPVKYDYVDDFLNKSL